MKMMGVAPRQQALNLVALQLLVVVVITLIWLVNSWIAAVSALLGGLSVVLPNLYFAFRFFATTQARQVNRIIRAFYWGELTKIVMTGILVIIFAKFFPNLNFPAFFSSFACACLGFWLAPLLKPKRVFLKNE